MLGANTEVNPIGMVEHRQGCNPYYIAHLHTNPIGVAEINNRNSFTLRRHIITSET